MTLRRAPSQVKSSVLGVAPSLTSQAAAQVAIQALIRKDRAPSRGVRAASVPQVSAPPSSPPLPSLLPRVCSRQALPPHLSWVPPPHEEQRLRAGACPAFPGGPARPEDVQRLCLTGCPGGH